MKVSQAFEGARLEPGLNQRMRCSRTAVREGIRDDGLAGIALQGVVADGARGAEPFLDVPGLEEVRRLVRVVRPDAREAVGLQLEPDGKLVRFDLVDALLQLVHAARDTEQGLHVVPDLVRDDIGAREIAVGAELLLEQLVGKRRST